MYVLYVLLHRWIRYEKFQVPIQLLVINSLISSLIISEFLIVSITHYPGGVAMDIMHKMATKRDLNSEPACIRPHDLTAQLLNIDIYTITIAFVVLYACDSVHGVVVCT